MLHLDLLKMYDGVMMNDDDDKIYCIKFSNALTVARLEHDRTAGRTPTQHTETKIVINQIKLHLIEDRYMDLQGAIEDVIAVAGNSPVVGIKLHFVVFRAFLTYKILASTVVSCCLKMTSAGGQSWPLTVICYHMTEMVRIQCLLIYFISSPTNLPIARFAGSGGFP